MMVSSSRSRMRSMRGGPQRPGTPVVAPASGAGLPAWIGLTDVPRPAPATLLLRWLFGSGPNAFPSDGKLWTGPACRARGVQRAILPRPCGHVARISPMRVACLNRAGAAIRMPAPTRMDQQPDGLGSPQSFRLVHRPDHRLHADGGRGGLPA